METSVIVVAAGLGSRMNAGMNKQFLELAGKPILYHTLKVFQDHPKINEIILVVKEEEISYVEKNILGLYEFYKVQSVVSGGEERADSVNNGLDKVKHNGVVLIHDGARPFVSADEVSQVIEAVVSEGAALVGTPVKDTIKLMTVDMKVRRTLQRNQLYAASTPQGFKVSLIREAFSSAKDYSGVLWDDAMVVELLGKDVVMVKGSYDNIKITTPLDLVIGEGIINRRLEEKHG